MNANRTIEIDGQIWHLTYIDSTHFYMSNSNTAQGWANHIGQHAEREYYNEINNWLKQITNESKNN